MNKVIMKVEKLGFPWKTRDPFLFCAYHEDKYPAGNKSLGIDAEKLTERNPGNDFVKKDGWRMYHGSSVPGFPYHPHRGFETVTINKGGFTDHADSLGAAGRFGKNDVQWMTAGKGVQHSEMFPLLNAESSNHLELFQVWLNLPKKSKFVEPHFKMLWKEDIPRLEISDEKACKSIINVIAGKFNEIMAPEPTPDSWAADPENEVAIWTIQLEAGAQLTLPLAGKQTNRVIYFYRGGVITISGTNVEVEHSVELNPTIETSIEAGDEPAFLLLLQGRPINEPVVQYGPFVMNTQAEIQEAYKDYQETQFGGWPWSSPDQVHDKNKGRFALHADGKLEER